MYNRHQLVSVIPQLVLTLATLIGPLGHPVDPCRYFALLLTYKRSRPRLAIRRLVGNKDSIVAIKLNIFGKRERVLGTVFRLLYRQTNK